jgi:hypothetical protein
MDSFSWKSEEIGDASRKLFDSLLLWIHFLCVFPAVGFAPFRADFGRFRFKGVGCRRKSLFSNSRFETNRPKPAHFVSTRRKGAKPAA